jgi:hypothetical protein
MIFTPHREYGSKRFLAFRRRRGRSRRPQPTFVRQCRCRLEALESRAILAGADVVFTQGTDVDPDYSSIEETTWINRIPNQNNSWYFEGVSALQRIYFSGIEETFEDHYALAFTYPTQKSGS